MTSRGRLALWASRIGFSAACLVWMGFIFQASSFTPSEVNENFGTQAWLGPYRDIVGHLGIYAILGSLLQFSVWAWLGSIEKSFWWSLVPVVIAALYGISDEYHQSLVPGRAASIKDILVDTLGAILAVVVVTSLAGPARQWLQSRRNPSAAG